MTFFLFVIAVALAWTGSKVAHVGDELTMIRKLLERDRGGR